jgi:hypothetical protein
MEAISSSETSVLTRATWRNISEDTIFHGSHLLAEIERDRTVSAILYGVTY